MASALAPSGDWSVLLEALLAGEEDPEAVEARLGECEEHLLSGIGGQPFGESRAAAFPTREPNERLPLPPAAALPAASSAAAPADVLNYFGALLDVRADAAGWLLELLERRQPNTAHALLGAPALDAASLAPAALAASHRQRLRAQLELTSLYFSERQALLGVLRELLRLSMADAAADKYHVVALAASQRLLLADVQTSALRQLCGLWARGGAHAPPRALRPYWLIASPAAVGVELDEAMAVRAHAHGAEAALLGELLLLPTFHLGLGVGALPPILTPKGLEIALDEIAPHAQRLALPIELSDVCR
ncbi:hypothetical protein T492DRAFT_879734 [Pavlovales sp. CCMP2436]|nr:hypothetical protein T492DRAFT_879734 [Pavlovales sp. CCMP2436]